MNMNPIYFYEDLGRSLPSRAYWAIRNTGIESFKELSSYTRHELLEIKGVGKVSVNEIVKLLEYHGMELSNG